MTAILLSLLLTSSSYAKDANESDKILPDCEIVLAGTSNTQKPTLDQFQDHLVLLERHIDYLHTLRHPQFEELRRDLNALYEGLVSETLPKGFKSEVRRLAIKIRDAVDNRAVSNLIPPSVNGLLSGRDKLEAHIFYENHAPEVTYVKFTGPAVKALLWHERHFLEKVFKSIAKGIVRRDNTSGIKRLGSVNAKLVELKIHPTSFRMMGCLENGHITFKEAVKKSGAFFAYAAYADFCP